VYLKFFDEKSEDFDLPREKIKNFGLKLEKDTVFLDY
jgi:hypothetical protein